MATARPRRVFLDGQVQRPPVIDYKLGTYPTWATSTPTGRILEASCWSRRTTCSRATTSPEVTAEVFDVDGYYRTGDIMAEVGPDQLVYLDRRNFVLKLAQGEFVTVSKLEAAFGTSPLVRQIYVYGNSARAYLLAVVVPTEEAPVAPRRESLRSSPSQCRTSQGPR